MPGMTAGSVTVADDESASGTGLALELYDARVAAELPFLPDPETPPAGMSASDWAALARSVRLDRLRGFAREATAYAVTVTYIRVNAVVTTTVDTSTGALQTVSGLDTDPPSADRTLPGSIA